jgi:CheY-like chemotaxis protein
MVLDTFSALWGSLGRFRHSVALRLLATVLLFSCAVTLLLTALQLYGDYEHGIALIADRLSDINEATNGREGLGKAQDERPALVITSGMDGLETTRRLRETPELTGVPIIVVSASPSGVDENKSLAAGANAFVPKPVDFDRLLVQIGTLLKLEWNHAPRTHCPPRPFPDKPPAVPAAQMEELHRLARTGNMRDIITWAERISSIDPQYEPFTAHLRGLAKGYQSKATLQLVEHYLEARLAS